MKNLVNLMVVVLLSFLSVACKSPSATSGSEVVGTVPAETTTATDASGNTTTTSTAADGTITTTITSADGTSVTTVALPADVDNTGSAGGVWRGVLVPNDGVLPVFYKVMVSPSNHVVMLSESGASFEIQGSDMMQATSFIQTSEEITINLSEYAKENDGAAPVDIVLIGNLTPKGNMKGTYTKGVETGAFVFVYDPIYENDETPYFYTQDSGWSLSKTVVGGDEYEVTYVIGDSVRMISVDGDALLPAISLDADGEVIGTNPLPDTAAADTQGCIYNGNISIVNPNYVLYNMTMLVTGCALAGEYEGLATLEERFTYEEHPHDHYRFMTFGLSDGTNTINNRLTFRDDQLRT